MLPSDRLPSAMRSLEAGLDALVARIAKRAAADYSAEPTQADLTPEELAPPMAVVLRAALTALVEQRPASADDLAHAARLGEERAGQGVSLGRLLVSVRAATREGLELLGAFADEAGIDAASALALTGLLLEWVDAISDEITASYRRTEPTLARGDDERLDAFVLGLVDGRLAPGEIVAGARALDLDVDSDYVVLRARSSVDFAAAEIHRAIVPSRWSPGLAVTRGEEVVAILRCMPERALPVAAGVGPPVRLSSAARSHHIAGIVLDTALAFGLTGCHRLEDLSLLTLVVGEHQVGETLVARYVTVLEELGRFGEDVLLSLQTYLRCELNVERAANELFVHQNTLRHRLSRFEQVTGADLRKPQDLAEVWWAVMRAQALSAPR
jgi:hypothetical protein